MKIKFVFAFLIILLSYNLNIAQKNILLIKANTSRVAIKDGNQSITRWWEYLQTNVKPVVYHISKINQNRKVTFYTDIDSISFDVKPNNKYDFKVLLKGKDTCYAQISTVIPSYYKDCKGCVITSDTIPFTLGNDHYIHIKGKVNNSRELDFIFDTGAGACLLNEKGQKKAKIILDGLSDGEGTSGTSVDSTSSSNHLQINNLQWNNLPLGYIDYKGSINTDGVIGYNIFEDKVVEIDNEKNILIIHNKLPSNMSGYAKQKIRHDLNGTFIQATINNENTDFTAWYLFDTGGSLTMEVSGDYAKSNNLYGTMKNLGKSNSTGNGKGFFQTEIVELPVLKLLGFELPKVPIHIASSDKSFYGEAGIIGNNVLKRFNTIIDYPNATIYLKPNSLMNMTYKKKDNSINMIIIGISAVIALSFLGFYIFNKRQNKKIGKQINKMRIILFLIFFCGISNLVLAQEGNLIRDKIANKYILSYHQLKEYEGVYEYKNNSTIKIAASPIDTTLICIINESRYPFSTLSKDIFLNATKDSVVFFRDKDKKVAGCIAGKDTFKKLPQKIKFPKSMWYARLNVPKDYTYTYKQPINVNDGLTVGNLEGTGLDKKLLAEMAEKIVGGTYPNVHSILIVKDGKLVFEEYFYEHHKNKLHELRSATKSFISALTGIAIEKGYIKSVNEKVLPYFPEYTFKNLTDNKSKITIQNLLTNQSGLDCDVYNPKAFGNESEMAYKPDWIQYSLDLPMNDIAGEIGQYCSSNPIIMGRIIEKATKMPLPKFAEQTLFKDLSIKNYEWNFKPDSSSAETFCQLNLKSRDIAKFGLLYLNNGLWNGKQVISKQWIEQSLAKHTVIAGLDYGYLWWTRYLDANGTRYYGKLAQGNGGQKIYIFKELNLVVVITAGHYNMQSSSNELIAKYILPAFNKK